MLNRLNLSIFENKEGKYWMRVILDNYSIKKVCEK